MDKSSSEKIAPALGISWANLVTMRLMLARTSHTVDMNQTVDDSNSKSYQSPVRTMEILFAPSLPNTLCRYIIDQEGVRGLI